MRTKGTITCKILVTRFLEVTHSERSGADSVTQPRAGNYRKEHLEYIGAVQNC